MSDMFANEPMLEMYIVEMNQMINRLEQLVMNSEEENALEDEIDEIFRHMHTIKGNSMMMMFEEISNLAHAVEDLYDYLRKEKPADVNYSKITDLVLEAIDFFKEEVESIENGDGANGESSALKSQIREYLESIKFMNGDDTTSQPKENDEQSNPADQKYYIAPLKDTTISNNPKTTDDQNYYSIKILFEEDCQMESVRAFSVVHKLKDICDDLFHFPQNIVEENHDEKIRIEGFQVYLNSDFKLEDMNSFFESVSSMRSVEIEQIEMSHYYDYRDIHDGVVKEPPKEVKEEAQSDEKKETGNKEKKAKDKSKKRSNESYINVGISKLTNF